MEVLGGEQLRDRLGQARQLNSLSEVKITTV